MLKSTQWHEVLPPEAVQRERRLDVLYALYMGVETLGDTIYTYRAELIGDDAEADVLCGHVLDVLVGLWNVYERVDAGDHDAC